MPIAHVQTGGHGASTGVTTSIAVTLGAAVGGGNLVVGHVFWPTANPTDLISITDDKGNTYTVVDKQNGVGAGLGWNRTIASFHLPNITNGPITITANFALTVGLAGIFVDEYSSAATATPLDAHAAQAQGTPGTAANAVSSGSMATAANGDLIYAGSVDPQGSSNGLNPGTGFTARTLSDTSMGVFFSSEDQIQSSAGSIAGTFTAVSPTDATMTCVMALKAAGAAGGTVRSRRIMSPASRAGSRQMMELG